MLRLALTLGFWLVSASPTTLAQTGPVELVTGITNFSFSAYSISGTALPLASAANLTAANGATKQLQISLVAARNSTTAVAATNTVLSARFVLRNKKVTA